MSRDEFDYILVGAGVASATIAMRLLKANPSTSILILEAGPVVPAKSRRAWWDYVVLDTKPYAYAYDQPGEYATLGNVHWDFRENRVMAYGGSTLHWGGWSLRFKPEDFHLRDNTGEGADWPFGYSELEDYYFQAEDYLSVSGDHNESWNQVRGGKPYPLPTFDWTAADGEMIEAFQRLDIEPGKMPLARFRKCMATGTCKYCPFGARFTAQQVLDDLCGDDRYLNFRVRCHAPATRILLSSKRRVNGVEYLDAKTGAACQALADRVVICSGTYESPKLLLLSSCSEWPQGIGNDHGRVGQFITSHSILSVRGTKSPNNECWFQEYDFPTLMSRTYDTPDYQAHGKLFLFKNRRWPSFDFAQAMIQGLSRKQIEAELRKSRTMELQAFLEEKGREGNRLTIGHGKNRFGLPNTAVSFSRSSAEIADAKSRLELMTPVLKEMGYQVQAARVEDPGGHHATGTCRMAESPADGVTDAHLRVHGLENLFICSNAVFPSGSAVNPTLTLTALAMRLADSFQPARKTVRSVHLEMSR